MTQEKRDCKITEMRKWLYDLADGGWLPPAYQCVCFMDMMSHIEQCIIIIKNKTIKKFKKRSSMKEECKKAFMKTGRENRKASVKNRKLKKPQPKRGGRVTQNRWLRALRFRYIRT